MSQFGGPPQADDYGYFGPPKATTSGSQFGTPAAPGPSQFGAPAPAPYASPPAAPPKKSGNRGLKVVGVALLVLVGLYVAGDRYVTVRQNRPITLPASLNGKLPTTDPRLLQIMDDSNFDGVLATPGANADGGAYGDQTGFLMLIVMRGSGKPEQMFAGFGSSVEQLGAPVSVGKSSCVTTNDQLISLCVRSGRFLTVAVASVKASPAETAAAVDVAWSQN